MNKHLIKVRQIVGINPTAKAVLRILADRADESGKCYPSMQTIAEDMCMSRRSVATAISNLEKLGYITRHRDQHFNVYTLHVDDLRCANGDTRCETPSHLRDISDVQSTTSDVKYTTPDVQSTTSRCEAPSHKATISIHKQHSKQQSHSPSLSSGEVELETKVSEATSFRSANHPDDIVREAEANGWNLERIKPSDYREIRNGDFIPF